MARHFHFFLSAALILGTGFAVGGIASAQQSAEPDAAGLAFERDVRPVLKAQCFHCHGEEEEVKAGLDLRLVRFQLKGGQSGPALVPGDAGASLLFREIDSGEMPKGHPRLPDETIELIGRWINEGAKTARPEPEVLGPEHLFTDEEREWWSLQPLARHEPPAIEGDGDGARDGAAHPIDAFVAARHGELGLGFSPEAEPRVLLRRLSYGLTGLPPTPGEMERYLEAHAADPETAFAAEVDRLLDSPAYGERWARHWLDVAGYADSDGYTERDLERPHAWRYRDYVVRAFNADKPLDAFVREQLAGDEIAALQGLHANSLSEAERERYAELLAATGFLRMAPDGTGAQNDITARNDSISDTLTIVSTALYGMTIHCAQCHDHRYDPISQKDYFALRAVFEPGFDPANWRAPNARLVSLQTKEEAEAAALIEEEAKALDAARLEKQAEFIAEVLEKLLAEVEDEALREPLREAYRTEAKERGDEQKKLLAQHPKINQLGPGSLYLYDTTYKTKHADTLKTMAEEVAKIRERKPPIRFVHAFAELAKAPEAVPATHLHFRGDPESPKDVVAPSDLSVLSGWREVAIPENSEAFKTTGRRHALAEQLTDGTHPLLARVLANRVWMHHFGRGIVATPGDFGLLGGGASHPELLDWLATELVEQGWSLKQLHRSILLSHTWRQSSTRDAERERLDPDNVYLTRQNLRRLEAESLRDALLAVSGKLNPKPYGEPIPVMRNAEGSVMVGNDNTDSAGRPRNDYVSLEGEEFRRSIYVQARRSRPLEIFQTFDAPDMNEANCDLRPVTTVSPQSLLLMNNALMREFARYFAERLRSDGGPDAASQVREAWRLAYAGEPTEEEVAAAVAYLEGQRAYYEENPVSFESAVAPAEKEPAEPELLALASLCHAILSANPFLYID